MRVVTIDPLKPGYVVGQALLDDRRQTLLHVGVAEKYITTLDRPCVAVYRDASGKSVEPFEFDLNAVEEVTLRAKPPVL